ncbi:hypothetical protein D9757_000526 [Collybiopsis confluens]|uniref:Cdc6/ORC1-like ATPase lid domain-containing protein n=1 Tax=Collybiopsis confluens TaxID=2823264 RepID=A0A8H5MGA8_9AGAR|nr:hypothetical protein D9757_000526 [Collybiopsis confluens]
MPSTRVDSVLGKRAQRQDQSSYCEQLQTPDPTPESKRLRTSSVLNGDGNKENIPPFALNALNENASPTISARGTRALRRSATETTIQSTPVKSKQRNDRSASISSTPTTPATIISSLHISTPPPTPPTLLPFHIQARALLRATCDDIDQLPGREEERRILAISSLSPSRAMIKASIKVSTFPVRREELADVKIIIINCMALNDVDALWQRMFEELNTSKMSKAAGRSMKPLKGREGAEAVVAAMKTKCIMVLDELDHIVPTSQSFASLLSLPKLSSGLLRVLAIANTHTLSTTTTPNICTLHFAPYTSAQLLQILQSRLTHLYESEKFSALMKKFLPVPTLTLVAKKVASLTGDVRCLFEVLRGGIDLATKPSSNAGQSSILAATYVVTPAHILSALKKHTPTPTNTPSPQESASSASNSAIVLKISALGLQARLVLLAVLLSSRRLKAGLTLSHLSSPLMKSSNSGVFSKSFDMDTHQLHGYYSNMLSRGDSDLCSPASKSEFVDLIGMLEGNGLVNVATVTSSSPTKMSKRTFGRSTSFTSAKNKSASTGNVRLGPGVWVDEVLQGLGINNVNSSDVREEEARALWMSESSRLSKEVKALQTKSIKPAAAGFADAFED